MDEQWRSLLKDGVIWKGYDDSHSIDVARLKIKNFLEPQLRRLSAHRVLEVGCGSGIGPIYLRSVGFEAYGVDPHFREDVTEQYEFLSNDDGTSLPYPSQHFDLVYSLETIEHVGTRDGMLDLVENYDEIRMKFLSEICRVSARYVIITTPNRLFPVDEHSADRNGNPSFRFHSPFEAKTFSARDLKRQLRYNNFRLVTFLNPKGYYQLERVKRIFGTIGLRMANRLLNMSSNSIIGYTALNPHLFLLFERTAK